MRIEGIEGAPYMRVHHNICYGAIAVEKGDDGGYDNKMNCGSMYGCRIVSSYSFRKIAMTVMLSREKDKTKENNMKEC